MTILRTVAHLLLALVLLAGGLAPASAAGYGDLPASSMEPPCHGMANDAGDPPADADCCQDGGCACDCLHHSPAGFLATSPMPRIRLRGLSEQGRAPVFSATSGAPEVRPPIA